MQTGAISFRVADFLKQYPPFQYLEEFDLLELVARGRVRFHEADEYILWQGSSHGLYMPVIQQGTVSLWENQGAGEHLRDILGAGDVLGLDRLHGSETCRYSAKSQSEVVVYALPADAFERLVTKYPQAAEFVASQASVSSSYRPPDERLGAHQTFLQEVARQREPLTCDTQATVREAVRRMLETSARAIAIVDSENSLQGVLTLDRVLRSVAAGKPDSGSPFEFPVETFMDQQPSTVLPDAAVSESVLAMEDGGHEVVAITENGKVGSRLHGLLSAQDLVVSFGDQPAVLFQEISHAPNPTALRGLQQRAREFILSQLSTASAVDWLARLAFRIDAKILARIVEWNPPPVVEYCWCYYAPAGREESLTPVLPNAAIILADTGRKADFIAWYGRVHEVLAGCGYVPPEHPAEASLCCAGLAEWKEHFKGWIEDPVRNDLYQARTLFDLKPVVLRPITETGSAGSGQPSGQALAQQLASAVGELIRAEPDFLPLLAHDCLANLPPLTFFRDVVIGESGEESSVFQLEQSALRPLVDVGRVFGIAAGIAGGRVLGGSTLDRLAVAKRMLPEQDTLFREAAETFRVVLSLQARVGIRQRSSGFELPPALLSHHDRQVLKSGFRSILKLLEFTEHHWLEAP